MSELDEYLELLYDDLPSKIKGTGMILQLARTPDHLFSLTQSGEIQYLNDKCRNCLVGYRGLQVG